MVRNDTFRGFFRLEKPFESAFLVVNSIGDPTAPLSDTWSLSEAECLALVKSGLGVDTRSEEHTSELQSQFHLVCRLLLETKKQVRPAGWTGRGEGPAASGATDRQGDGAYGDGLGAVGALGVLRRPGQVCAPGVPAGEASR